MAETRREREREAERKTEREKVRIDRCQRKKTGRKRGDTKGEERDKREK